MSQGRGVLVVLATSMALVLGALLAWGPLPIGPHAHQYADVRLWLGIPSAANVLVNLPIFWLAVWGWCATRVSHWPRSLRLPWQGFHLWVMAAAVAAGMYHAAPSDAMLIATRTCQACAFTLLALGLLAERVDARFGSLLACCVSAVVVVATGLFIAQFGSSAGSADLRLLLLLESVPILLVPAVVLRVAGTQTRAADWVVALVIYAASRLLELADVPIFAAAGWISGHTLMHLGLAAVVGWMAYRAAVSKSSDVGAVASLGGSSQRQTSWNTTG